MASNFIKLPLTKILKNAPTIAKLTNNMCLRCSGTPLARSFGNLTRSHLINRVEPCCSSKPFYSPLLCRFSDFHTEADKELSNFLNDELKHEKKRQKPNEVNLTGFKVESKGAEVKLTKEHNGEIITISFNVNNSVDADDSMEMMEQSEELPQMVSRPAFCVEFRKTGGGPALVLDCQFTERDEEEPEMGGQEPLEKEVFEIVEAWMQEGEMDDATYVISSENMDGTLYDILVNAMCDRGLDDAFIAQLSRFATEYEHKEYISFLEKLQGFATS